MSGKVVRISDAGSKRRQAVQAVDALLGPLDPAPLQGRDQFDDEKLVALSRQHAATLAAIPLPEDKLKPAPKWQRLMARQHKAGELPALVQERGPASDHRDAFAREIEVPFFVDWLHLEQQFDFDVPEFNGGMVQKTDVEGEVEWRIVRASVVEGSHETSVQIRSHANKVMFQGNVSRFGRPDNLFGYDLGECLQRINVILARVGLPAFTMGQRAYTHVKSGDSMRLKAVWTGAKVKRIDLTANYETGSKAALRGYMRWLAQQQTSARIKVGTHGDGETVDWQRGSRRVYAKAYAKDEELAKRGGPPALIQHCADVGLLRFEVTVKAMQLATMGCDYLGGLDMGQLVELFKDRAAVLSRAEHTVDDLESLPNHFRRTARDYLAGDDVRKHLSLAGFKRHRKALLPYGIDIAVRHNVTQFQPRVQVIELRPAQAPSWYEFDERLVA